MLLSAVFLSLFPVLCVPCLPWAKGRGVGRQGPKRPRATSLGIQQISGYGEYPIFNKTQGGVNPRSLTTFNKTQGGVNPGLSPHLIDCREKRKKVFKSTRQKWNCIVELDFRIRLQIVELRLQIFELNSEHPADFCQVSAWNS